MLAVMCEAYDVEELEADTRIVMHMATGRQHQTSRVASF